MSEIADELERMAAFYDQESKTHEEMRAEAKKSWDEAEDCYRQGKAEMCTDVATRLRERAAELRAQRSEQEDALSLAPGDHIA